MWLERITLMKLALTFIMCKGPNITYSESGQYSISKTQGLSCTCMSPRDVVINKDISRDTTNSDKTTTCTTKAVKRRQADTS